MVESGILIGIVSAESFSNMYYILKRLSSHEKAMKHIRLLSSITETGSLSASAVKLAMSSGWDNFEDALQFHCALEQECSVIITRNTKDFSKSTIPVLTPSDFIKKS